MGSRKRLHRLVLFGVFAVSATFLTATASMGAIAQPLDMMLVLDNSGSMARHDPTISTRTVVTDFMDRLDESDRLGILLFDTDARVTEPLGAVMGPEVRQRIIDNLVNINYRGQFTNTPAAIERALYELRTQRRDTALQIIILVTDGIVDTGDAAQDIEKERWLKDDLTLAAEREGVRIFGIALTDNADFRLIQTVAVRTDGDYYRASGAGEVPRVLERIVEAARTPATQAVPQPIPVPEAPPEPIPTPLPKEEVPPPEAPTSTAPEAIPAAPAGGGWPMLVASGAVLLMGVVLAIIVYYRLGKVTPMGTVLAAEDDLPPDHPLNTAELIDANRIVADNSLSLRLKKRTVRIGRDSSNEIVIARESISSLHASIEYRDGFFYLEDHRSTNGTFLNGKRISESTSIRLKSGDKISFALFDFRFLLPDQTPFGETVMVGSPIAPSPNGRSK